MKDSSPRSTERTGNYVRQVGGSLIFKAGAVGASFLAVPLMIHYLGQERYGVWATLLGIISWVVFFDLGVGSGLRNKVAESLANERRSEAARYIASGYTLIAGLALALWVMTIAASWFVPWQTVFNTTLISQEVLRTTVQVAGSFILLNFWVGLIGALIGAIQKTAWIAAGQLLSNAFSLLLVWLLSMNAEASTVYLAWAYGVSLVVSNALLSMWFFIQHRDLRPRISIALSHVRPILSIGGQFFVIQIAGLLIFTTDKILITQLFGPESVTGYDVVFKLFGIMTFLHALISAPLWSAYTEAYQRGESKWIQQMLRKQLGVFAVFLGATGILALMAQQIASAWVGPEVKIDQALVLAMAILTCVSIWNNVFGMALGGMGKVRLGAIYTVFTAAVNLPLAYFFAKIAGFGIAGIVMATTLSIAASSLISPLQIYYFIFAKRRTAFWDRALR